MGLEMAGVSAPSQSSTDDQLYMSHVCYCQDQCPASLQTRLRMDGNVESLVRHIILSL